MSGFYSMIGMVAAGALGAGATAYGSNKARQSARDLQKQQQPLVDAQLANQKILSQYGPSFLQSGQQNYDIVQNYLRSLASGNRALTMQTLAPEINAMGAQQQAAAQAQANLSPRGRLPSDLSQLQQRLQGNIGNLLFSARSNAQQGLGTLAGNQTSLGLGALGQGAGLTNSLLNYGLNAQQQMFGQGQAIGQGISSLIGPFMQYYMMNRPAATTQTPSNFNFATAYQGQGGNLYGQPPSGWSGMAGSNLYGSNPSYTSYTPTST